MKKILISDPTLRDGSHAIRHKLTAHQIAGYVRMADAANIPIIEIGHGNGLGASSLQLGESDLSDEQMFAIARANINNSRLGIHVIPGFATIARDLEPALEQGVDVVRVASHCTEADITERHISFSRKKGKETYGVLMMSHMATKEILVDEARKMEAYGAEGVILMDSAGAYIPSEVERNVSELVNKLGIPIGFHAHNNLGLSIANSLAAVASGATILDGTIKGFGAGAGNAQLETLVAVLDKYGYSTGIDFYRLLDAADFAQTVFPADLLPGVESTSVVSGIAGVFSGFAIPVKRVAVEYAVDPRDIFMELGRRKVVGGQEDLIVEVALELARNSKLQLLERGAK